MIQQESVSCQGFLLTYHIRKQQVARAYMYILECSNGAYYTGSTRNLALRIRQHQNGEGAHYTRRHLPVRLVYFEEFQRIDEAFYREKQVQGWSRRKKRALIEGRNRELPYLSKSRIEQDPSTGSGPDDVDEIGASTGSAPDDVNEEGASTGSAPDGSN